MISEPLRQEKAKAWLSAHHLRQTRPRLAMVACLLETKNPVTLAELQKRAGQSCDFATVFRFMEILSKENLVATHSWGDRQLRYELAENQAGHHHHHHLVCKVCKRIESVDACVISKLEKNLSSQFGFKGITHQLEFFGVCPNCQ